MFTKKAHESDVSIWTTSYGFTKMSANTEAGLKYLTDYGFMPYNHSLNAPYEIEEPVARRIAASYLGPNEHLYLYAPLLAPRSFYQ